MIIVMLFRPAHSGLAHFVVHWLLNSQPSETLAQEFTFTYVYVYNYKLFV